MNAAGVARAARRRAFCTGVLCPLIFCLSEATAGHDPARALDATELSLEDLLEIKVYSASKFAQKMTEAPASVTIITAGDIRAYGYRTLSEILKSVRGLFVSYDRNYSYLGVRGFERPGDYDSRILLLVDGYRVNDTIYDTAGIGTEFPLDVSLIDRVEIVRGPGSAIYGSNAFFAVLNVITKRGRDFNGWQAAGGLASYQTDQERATGGWQHANGVEWLLSASRSHSEGQDLFYPEFDDPATNNGIAAGVDGDRYEKFFGKISGSGLTLTAGHSQRAKQIPTGSYGTVFNDPRTETVDRWSFIDLGYDGQLGTAWDITPHLFYGYYTYDGTYPFDTPPIVLNQDGAAGQWWGAELKLVGRFGSHKLVAGGEFQHNFRQDQFNYDEDPYALYLDDRRNGWRSGVYVQDEMPLRTGLLLNAGMRYDHYSTAGDALNPRVALVWSPSGATTLKTLVGTAFRAPNNYELFYSDGSTSKANPALDSERITAYEIVAEHHVDSNFRLTADLYYNQIRNLIEQVTDPGDDLLVFLNRGRVEAAGIEFEAERVWVNDAHVRVSYAGQRTRDSATRVALTNSPRHLAKLNFSVPVFQKAVLTGTELQYTSRRKTLSGGHAGSSTVVNLTLTSHPFLGGLEVSAGAYNLFDRDYADPARPEHFEFNGMDVIPQDGRNFRFTLSYRFD